METNTYFLPGDYLKAVFKIIAQHKTLLRKDNLLRSKFYPEDVLQGRPVGKSKMNENTFVPQERFVIYMVSDNFKCTLF